MINLKDSDVSRMTLVDKNIWPLQTVSPYTKYIGCPRKVSESIGHVRWYVFRVEEYMVRFQDNLAILEVPLCAEILVLAAERNQQLRKAPRETHLRSRVKNDLSFRSLGHRAKDSILQTSQMFTVSDIVKETDLSDLFYLKYCTSKMLFLTTFFTSSGNHFNFDVDFPI